MARSDGNYLVIRGYVDGTIQGERSFDTQQEAEYYGKQMLAYIKKMNPKAKKVTVDIDSMTNHSPGPKIKTLASRLGAKDMMAATPHKITLKDKSGVTQTWMVSDKILRDMNATKRNAEATGAKPDYSSVLRLGVRIGEVILASRPGAKAKFKVEDRFYFGKGRKERFAEPREIEAKIRAWIDSRGLPIGLQETNALSYIAAQHMLRGGVSIEQAVKSSARRHAQIGLASAGLRTWLGENA